MADKKPQHYCINRFVEYTPEELKEMTPDQRRKYNQKIKYHLDPVFREAQNKKARDRYQKIKSMIEMHKQLVNIKI